jgi:hypothetical protein
MDIIAAIAAVVGGIILLQFVSAGVNGANQSYSFTGRNIFETVSHGVGLYLVARGIMIARASHLAAAARDEAQRTTEAVRDLIEVTRQTSPGYRPQGTSGDFSGLPQA